MVKTIYSDVVLNFGKHKGRSVADILARDPGYFYWCREAGIAKLDADVNNAVDAWVLRNPKEASKTRNTALLVRKANMAPSSETRGISSVHTAMLDEESEKEEIKPSPIIEVARPETWGTW